MDWGVRVAASIAGAIAFVAASAAPAPAAVTIGTNFTPTLECASNFSFIQTTPVAGISYSAAEPGVIVAWATRTGATIPTTSGSRSRGR